MKIISKYASAWHRRSIRDAIVIGCICFAIYAAANMSDLFERTYAFAKEYEAYEVDDFIVVATAFGFLMLVYVLRRMQDLKLEIHKRLEAEKHIVDQATSLTTVFNNISQGILLFDSNERLVVCNTHYLKMYNLAPDVVKPGTSLREIVRYRIEKGLLNRQVDEYCAELLAQLAKKQISSMVVETSDGQEIAVTNYPMPGGGWIATHEDRTESRRREASFRLLFDNNPVPMWVFDRETLRFLAVNNAARVLYGYSEEQFLTMAVPDIRPEDKEDSAAFVRAMPESQNAQYVGEHQRADGTKIQVAVYSSLLKYEGREARLVAINDITARKLVEDDLRRTKMFLDTVIENVPLPILVKSTKDFRFTLINKASEELFGFTRDVVIGKTLRETFDKERAERIEMQDSECVQSNQPVISHDYHVSTHIGVRLINSKKVVIPGADGQPEYLLTVIDDVTERRRAETQIAHMAHSDPLTDLPNRTAFNGRLNATLEMAVAESRSFAILCMDLDEFKQVNDIYGHATGDSLLRDIADRLRAVAGNIFIARLGGDEFTMIAAGGERSNVARLTDRLLAAFVDDFEVDGHRLRQGLSIGVAIYPADGTNAKTLVNNADAALYRAKADGSSSVQFFKAEMAVRLRERAALQADLRSAIQHDELRLHYQPQVRMSGEITGFEALARWYSPKRGMVPPAEFIPLAEESSLILVLGEWVLREACREAASWDKPLKIAINVSPVQFRHGDLPRLVHSILLESGLAPSRLELEITEGVLIGDFSRAVSILRRLKSLGVQIALDDFGTGFSSLSYLHAFPFDKLKIDRSFISDLESNQQSIAIVHAVIGLSRSLNIPILAEGVETKAQHAFLVREGCDEVQGYLTGRPLKIADYADAVGRKTIAIVHARVG